MSRIKRNFYMLDGYDWQRITKEDRDKMSPDESEYWKNKSYWYVYRNLPDGRLYAGNSFQYPTKLTADDMPDDYLFLHNYHKRGYIRTAGVVSLIYKPSAFHNHAFKDDFLYISYSKDLGDYKEGYDDGSTFMECDEFIFGNDIVDFVFAVEKNSPHVDVSVIKHKLVEQYNAYCDEMIENGRANINGDGYKKIEKLEDLR